MKSRDTRIRGIGSDTPALSDTRRRAAVRELEAFSMAGAPVRPGAAAGSRCATPPAPVLGRGPAMTTTDAFEFNALPDAVLLGWLTARGHRPNVLIECSAANADTVMRHLMTWCSLPFRYCALPGKLELPVTPKGTLLLKDVAAMTLSQQVMLYDWLSVSRDMQVVSISTAPLLTLVEDGDFLEGLFYRLNVIRLEAMQGTRPAPLDAWQTGLARMA
jgi:hypothetical protein